MIQPDRLLQDLRIAVRSLRRTPGFSLAAILTLALGIAATATIFTVVNAVLLTPLPYAQPDQRVALWNRWTGFEKTWLSDAELLDYQRLPKTLSGVAGWGTGQANLTGGGEPIRVGVGAVTANTFSVLGAEPLVGRTFAEGEDRPGSDRVVVLGYALWQSHFGGDPVVGTTLQLDGVARTIVGIMPPRFQLPTDFGEDSAEPTRLWIPLSLDPRNRGSHGLYGAGQLAPGASAAHASAELRAIADSWTREGLYPAAQGFHSYAVPLEDEVRGEIRPVLILLAAAVMFLLLIACANVANLLLVRAEGRQREMAVRAAIGAAPWQLVRQLLAESALLAAAGTALGIAAAFAATGVLRTADIASLPPLGAIALDLRVLALTAAIGMATSVLFGLAPMLHATRTQLTDALRDGAQHATAGVARQRLRGGLVIAEMALAVMLVAGAGLMIRSVAALQSVNLGFDPAGVVTMRLALPPASYETPAQVIGFYERFVERVRALPGVRQAGLVRSLPLASSIGDWGLDIEGFVETPGNNAKGDWQVVSSGALEALGERLVRGRLFTAADGMESPPVAIINETMAARYWPNQDPIGRRIRQGNESRPWITVVGIVEDVRHNGIETIIKEKFYRPHTQFPASTDFAVRNMYLVVRSDGDPMSLVPSIRAEVRAMDASLPVANVRLMTDVVAAAMARPRLAGSVLTVFALLALVLASIGLYGVLAYLVSQRRHEIGIRLAIGADSGQVRTLVLRQGLGLALAGAFVGTAGGLVLSRLMQALLHGVAAHDPVTFAIVPAVLLAVALVASWLPARRATRVDPLLALRSE